MARTNAYSGSNKQHQFSMVPSVQVKRSTFDRSHNYKTTFNSGTLIPWWCEEILPGDTVKLSADIFARLATPIVPTLDNMVVQFFWFFVPNRLVWRYWPYFMGEEETPGDAELPPKYSVPQIVAPPTTGFVSGSVFDFLGLPVDVPGISVSALPFRAVNLIWSEWFRDQNLQDRPILHILGGIINQIDGTVPVVDVVTDYPLLPRNKAHGYFESALPFPQKGPAVLLPLGEFAPVGVIPGDTTPTFVMNAPSGTDPIGPLSAAKTGSAGEFAPVSFDPGGTSYGPITGELSWYSPKLRADLSSATSATINELRQAFQIQRLLERDARGGSRYTELLKSHFQVSSPDQRLQRPEFLGGGQVRVSINPVPQTSGSAGAGGYTDTPQGNLSAFGTASGNAGRVHYSATEHGHIIGLMAVRADLAYQNRIDRSWSRKTRFDFYWPALQAIGEQGILNKEIYATGAAIDDEIFGYQERWSEMRHRPNMITGKFRSNDPQSLDIWHLAQDLGPSTPTLSDAFIQDKPPINRIIAVPSEPEFLFDARINLHHTRPLPVYSVPGMIDHF